MKKLIMALCALCLTLGVEAQNETNSAVINTDNGHGTNPDVNELLSGFGYEYQAIENGFGIGMNLIIKNVIINGSLRSGDTDNYVTKNDGWTIGAGYNYRYWLGNRVYVEGSTGIQYVHSSMELKTGYKEKEKYSDGDFGLFLTPRVGICLGKFLGDEWGIYAGYRWDFNKFKFSKKYTNDFFTIGITCVF